MICFSEACKRLIEKSVGDDREAGNILANKRLWTLIDIAHNEQTNYHHSSNVWSL